MNIRFIISMLICFFTLYGTAQQPNIDSLKNLPPDAVNDTLQMILYGKIANAYSEINPDSALSYSSKMLGLARKHHFPLEEATSLNEMGYAQLNMGNFSRSLQTLLSSIDIARGKESEKNILPSYFAPSDDFMDRSLSPNLQRSAMLSRAYQFIGILHVNSGNYEKAIGYFKIAIPLSEEVNSDRLLCINHISLGRAYISDRQPDSALASLHLAYDFAIKADFHKYLGSILLNMGRVYQALKNEDSASFYFRRALAESYEHDYTRGVVASSLLIAEMFKDSGQKDSSLTYIRKGLTAANKLNSPELFLRSYKALAEFYRNAGNNDSAVRYQALIIKINDSLVNSKQIQQFQNIDFEAQQKQQEIEAAKKDYQNRLRFYLLLGGMSAILLVAIMLYRVSRQRKKSNALLQQQKSALEVAMTNLKSTQAQLIQSEKMASLGELTAGIAHEMQNPLNFVNNFSEVNSELIEETTKAIDSGKSSDAVELLITVNHNEEKIRFHGQRLDSIVKSMLQHTRTSTGQKEATDINVLTDEYMRLAYQGMKAKDKEFDATLKMELDQGLGNVNTIPQEIGRVLLNLYNNAFYAVMEKRRLHKKGYEPIVSVTTKKTGNMVVISVSDNGSGISQKVLNKIFQPFFTTKPAGQGTGLGLSLSYDIVKAHGGELTVNSVEGEGTTFNIQLPVNG